jgi:hypothetical protein
MPTSRGDEFIKCPYYRKNDSNRICCEGPKEKTGLNFTFEDSKKCREYMKVYCKNIHNYKKCMVCYMLDIRKYGVEDG